jgi:hypothetical protein
MTHRSPSGDYSGTIFSGMWRLNNEVIPGRVHPFVIIPNLCGGPQSPGIDRSMRIGAYIEGWTNRR